MRSLKHSFKQNIQFHWQLETINSRFWLVNILLRKFDTSSKKEMKMIKTQILWCKTKKKKMPQKYINALSNIVLWTHPIDPWCNMLQTLEKTEKIYWSHFENRTRMIMREKGPNTELSQVRIWTLFTQCEIRMKWNENEIRKCFFVGSNPSVAKMLLRPW